MAQESCDLNKDEAEILKPTSSSSPPSSPTTSSSPPPPPPPPTAQIPEPPQPPAAQFLSKPLEGVLTEASRKRKPVEATASAEAVSATVAVASEPLSPVLFASRCNVCRKRVGLTGFRCRCGELFCPRHRHSETHGCSFDYKTAGRGGDCPGEPSDQGCQDHKDLRLCDL